MEDQQSSTKSTIWIQWKLMMTCLFGFLIGLSCSILLVFLIHHIHTRSNEIQSKTILNNQNLDLLVNQSQSINQYDNNNHECTFKHFEPTMTPPFGSMHWQPQTLHVYNHNLVPNKCYEWQDLSKFICLKSSSKQCTIPVHNYSFIHNTDELNQNDEYLFEDPLCGQKFNNEDDFDIGHYTNCIQTMPLTKPTETWSDVYIKSPLIQRVHLTNQNPVLSPKTARSNILNVSTTDLNTV